MRTQICIVKDKTSLTRDPYDDVDMTFLGSHREDTVNFHCWAELGVVVEFRDLRCFPVWDRNVHFPEAEAAGGQVVKCGLLLLLDDIFERTNRLSSVYFHLKGLFFRVTADEAEEGDERHCLQFRCL